MNRPDNSPSSPDPDRAPPPRRGWRIGRIAGLALGCGVLAGVLGVYVIETRSGNETASAACAGGADLADVLDETARGEVAAMAALDRPFDVTALSFADADGAQTSLGALGGRTLLVNLWATWCAPCRAEMPALQALQRTAGDEDFAVVPISVDMGEADKPKAFYEEIGLTDLPFYQDGTMALFNDLKGEGIAFGLPVTLIVDPAGCARGAMNGPAEWASPDALRLVEAVTQASRPSS